MWWISERSGSINFPAYFINCNFFSPHCESEVEAIHEIKLWYTFPLQTPVKPLVRHFESAFRIANILHNEQRNEDRRRCRAYAFYLFSTWCIIQFYSLFGLNQALDMGRLTLLIVDTVRVNKLHAFYWMNSQRKYFHLFYFGKLVWVWRLTGDWWVS